MTTKSRSDYENVPKEYTCLDITLPCKDGTKIAWFSKVIVKPGVGKIILKKLYLNTKYSKKNIQIRNTKYKNVFKYIF